MPKRFVGPKQADDLLRIAETLIREKPYSSYLFAAGWAMAEAGIVDYLSSPEERHARIDIAKECWNESKKKYIERHMDDDWTADRLLAYPDRVQASILYLPMMHDMVNGWVKQETSDTLYRRQLQLATNNLAAYERLMQQGDKGIASNRIGLHYELSTSLAITRLCSPTLALFPSLARSDSGEGEKDQTHDLQLLHMKYGNIRSCVPVEVKPSGGYHMSRYDSVRIRAKVDLESDEDGETDFSYIDTVIAEARGNLEGSEISRLNRVTERLVGLAADFQQERRSRGVRNLFSAAMRGVAQSA